MENIGMCRDHDILDIETFDSFQGSRSNAIFARSLQTIALKMCQWKNQNSSVWCGWNCSKSCIATGNDYKVDT
ncbi:hypothetical protein THRCLA_21787 [Thraustotheca clavata]|uniref:Uncharacterized protein n=1 Tax=Thraustotheca clavata TaxID=74557 RepID=A0A1V9ZPC9_9STRA|nr:hypothetical protein THRCLA_21787 [Thraustotheca clavata]